MKCRPALDSPNSVVHCRSVHLRHMSVVYVVQHEITSVRLENLHFHKYSKLLRLLHYFGGNKN